MEEWRRRHSKKENPPKSPAARNPVCNVLRSLSNMLWLDMPGKPYHVDLNRRWASAGLAHVPSER